MNPKRERKHGLKLLHDVVKQQMKETKLSIKKLRKVESEFHFSCVYVVECQNKNNDIKQGKHFYQILLKV